VLLSKDTIRGTLLGRFVIIFQVALKICVRTFRSDRELAKDIGVSQTMITRRRASLESIDRDIVAERLAEN
jgi:Trp operon repressor